VTSADAYELHPICACCGAPCDWVHTDRVAFGSEHLIFTERVLTCTGCGRYSTPTYMPWRRTARRGQPISLVDALTLCGEHTEQP
jgi:hypothetical protein